MSQRMPSPSVRHLSSYITACHVTYAAEVMHMVLITRRDMDLSLHIAMWEQSPQEKCNYFIKVMYNKQKIPLHTFTRCVCINMLLKV